MVFDLSLCALSFRMLPLIWRYHSASYCFALRSEPRECKDAR